VFVLDKKSGLFASAPNCGGRYGKHPDLYLILQSQKNTRILVLKKKKKKTLLHGYSLSIQKLILF
jgi:hypothetical protein